MQIGPTAWWMIIRLWYRRRAAVPNLEALGDRTLKDIGPNRSEIQSVVRSEGFNSIRGEALAPSLLQFPC